MKLSVNSHIIISNIFCIYIQDDLAFYCACNSEAQSESSSEDIEGSSISYSSDSCNNKYESSGCDDTETHSDPPLQFSPITDSESTDSYVDDGHSLAARSQSITSETNHLHSETPPTTCIRSYKITGDNIDKNVRPRYMRVKKFQTQSLHLFHSFAVADRIDTTLFPDVRHHMCLPSPEDLAKSLLPSKQDDEVIRQNFSILISRVLIEHMSSLGKSFKDIVASHIPHIYDKEMSQKSEVVRRYISSVQVDIVC